MSALEDGASSDTGSDGAGASHDLDYKAMGRVMIGFSVCLRLNIPVINSLLLWMVLITQQVILPQWHLRYG